MLEPPDRTMCSVLTSTGAAWIVRSWCGWEQGEEETCGNGKYARAKSASGLARLAS